MAVKQGLWTGKKDIIVKKGRKSMKKLLVIVLVASLVPFLSSCFKTSEKAINRTGEGVGGVEKGTEGIVEGAGKGTVELGKGTVGMVKGTAEMTGEFVTGRGDEATESGKAALESGKEGITGIIVEPLEGLGESFKKMDAGIKKATGNEDIK